MHERKPAREMLETDEFFQEKKPTDVSRRSMLAGLGGGIVGLGTLGLGTGEAAGAATLVRTASAKSAPHVGALYDPRCGMGRYWNLIPEVPALGRYDLRARGPLDFHFDLLRDYGIEFLLVSYRRGADSAGQSSTISGLFDRSEERSGPALALMLEADEDAARWKERLESGGIAPSAYVRGMADWWLERYDILAEERRWLGRDRYLRGDDGRKVLAFAGAAAAGTTGRILEQVLRRRPAIAAETSIWLAGGHDERHDPSIRQALAATRGGWFVHEPLAGDGWSGNLSFYRQAGSTCAQRIISVSPSYGYANVLPRPVPAPRDDGQRLRRQLEDVRRLSEAPHYVVVNSFNHWETLSTLEPNTEQNRKYLEIVRGWLAA